MRFMLFRLGLVATMTTACDTGGGADGDDDTIPPPANDDDGPPDRPTTLKNDFIRSLRLSYYGDPSVSMGVGWRTEEALEDPWVEYGLSPDRLDRYLPSVLETFSAPTIRDPAVGIEELPVWVYKTRLEGLEPDTVYYYRVSDARHHTDTYSFTTAPARGTRGPIGFVVVGDNRSFLTGAPSPIFPALAERIRLESFEFTINTGDMTKDSLQSDWDDYFDQISGTARLKPWIVCLGNHDAKVNGSGSYHRNNLLPNQDGPAPKNFYSFDYGNVHFVALDTQDITLGIPDDLTDSEQKRWLREDLAATDQDWIIAFFHKSAYNSSSNHGSIGEVQRGFVPLFNEFGVDIAFMGHDHLYDRTHFLHGLMPPGPGNDLPEGGGTRPAEICESHCARGTLWITTDGGGAGLYEPYATPHPFTAVSAKAYHYIKVIIDGDTYRHEVTDIDGNRIDAFEFTRFNRRD